MPINSPLVLAAKQNAPFTITGFRLALKPLALAGPVLVVAFVLGLLVISRIQSYHDNPAGFIAFGKQGVQYTHPPRGAPLDSPFGYDGQFYWIQANDPLLLKRSTIADMRGPGAGYHFQRPAYPALAFLLALGQRDLLPWTMLAVNILAVLGITLAFAIYCRRQGWSSWWALAVGLTPGLLMPSLRDLTDPLAIAAMLGGVLAWQADRRWWAAGLLTTAVLSRESMIAAVVAIGVAACVGCWRARHQRGAVRRIVAQTWPAIVVPAAAFLAWQAYIRFQVPTVPGSATAGTTAPPGGWSLTAFVDQIRQFLHGVSGTLGSWDVVYLALTLAAMVVAIVLARRGSAAGVAALLFAATLTVISFGDQWGITRYSAPLFAMLLLGGLEQRSRVAVGLCVAASATSIFLPWVITGL